MKQDVQTAARFSYSWEIYNLRKCTLQQIGRKCYTTAMKQTIRSKKSAALILAASLAAAGLFSCKSTPVVISDDMTTKELIQKGQDAYQNNKYKNALAYYQAVVERSGDDKSAYIEARYEIGHLYMKQKKYKLAEPIFQEIKDMFLNSVPGTLPAAYNKLADIELAKIPERKAAAAKAAAAAEAAKKQSPDTY